MTKSEIKHITDKTTAPKKDPELVFTGLIGEDDGRLYPDPVNQPDNLDNVRHLVGNLFYAYDNDAPEAGIVYIGKFV